MREFGISENFIKKLNRSVLILFCSTAVFLVVFALINLDFRTNAKFFAVGKTLLISGIILLIVALRNNRRLHKLKIFIDEDKFVQQSGKKQHILLWDDIAGIKTIEKKNGSVDTIRLYVKKPKRTIHLRGFRDMDDLARLIKERTSGEVILHEKRLKLNFETVCILMLIPAVIIIIIGMSVIVSMGKAAVGIFAIIMAISAGLFLLTFRPITKSDISRKWIEFAYAAILLILGFYGLIRFLSSGKVF